MCSCVSVCGLCVCSCVSVCVVVIVCVVVLVCVDCVCVCSCVSVCVVVLVCVDCACVDVLVFVDCVCVVVSVCVSGQQHAPDALYPRERPSTRFTGGSVGPRARLDWRKSRPHRDSIPDLQLIVSSYID